MRVLITGGAGYIGSHTVIELQSEGYEVVVVDNLSNSNEESLRRVEKITGKTVEFYKIDLRDTRALDHFFSNNSIDAVIHFAAHKAVGESVKKPLEYYDNNLISTISLLKTMSKYSVNKFVFSSSATVYGDPGVVEYAESLPSGQGISSPYGETKYMIEKIIRDVAVADSEFETTILRYFNPIGAHESGTIGEDPLGVPNNLMPFMAQVAAGRRKKLLVFGNDYPTPDGTCKRDYIHVMDLARGHVVALQQIRRGTSIYNLGSGKSTSVLELINTFMEATGQKIPYEFAPRREGDLPEFYASPSKANNELHWSVKKSIQEACEDSWRWQLKNPNGYIA